MIKEDLVNKFNEVYKARAVDRRYYHFRSVRNFIKYYDELNEGKKKREVYEALIEYLDYIAEHDISDRNSSYDLYKHYLHPIGWYYVKRFGFTTIARFDVMLLIASIPSIIIYLMFPYKTILLIVIMTNLIFFVYVISKYLHNKTYGFMW